MTLSIDREGAEAGSETDVGPRETEALESRLLQAAVELLEQQPPERLSLRRVALSLGVSHQAPYVHFGSKKTFLAAVAGVGLQRAAEVASVALAEAGDDPVVRLHRLADEYLRFARERPNVHDLAFGALVSKSDHPRLQRAAISYWTLLHDTVAACQPAGLSEGQILRRCAIAWGTLHGIARLWVQGQIPKSVPGDIDGLIHESIDTLQLGWVANDFN